MDFNDFALSYSGNLNLVNELYTNLSKEAVPKKFLPINCSELHASYQSLTEQDNAVIQLASIITQLSVDLLENKTNLEEDQQKIFSYRSIKSKNEAMEGYLFIHAARFSLTKLGACGCRASYGALKLKQIFNNKFQVSLVSEPKHDHFIVSLIDGEKLFIYDPLTNFEKIYDKNYYYNTILPKFPVSWKNAHEMNLVITENMVQKFFSSERKIHMIMKGSITNTLSAISNKKFLFLIPELLVIANREDYEQVKVKSMKKITENLDA